MKTSALALRVIGFAVVSGAMASGAMASVAQAHPVTVDGDATEWSTRLADTPNVGLVARTATGAGELVWRDVVSDTRTDVSTPETVADIVAFQVTGDATGVSFLLRRPPGTVLSGAPIQVQIAIDIDRVAGSGQEFLAGFADTRVADGARWERLVQTLFGSGGTAQVIDTSFNQVATIAASQGANADVEMFVPWSALGFAAPPTTALRFTVATFRAQSNDLTIDIGGGAFSNALDAVTNYGDPAASSFPNTFAEVQDGVIDQSFDVWFTPAGEVYAPLVVQSFVPVASGGGAGEWIAVRNVTPAPLSLAGFKVGDGATPDGAEGMFSFPAATLAAGAAYTIARSGAAYQAFFSAPPDAELPPGSSVAVPDMIAYAPWASGTDISLADPGDQVAVLDPWNTLVDVAVYGTATYPGINAHATSLTADQLLSRAATSSDTDDCMVDFSLAGMLCSVDAQCGGACFACVAHTCGPKGPGAACGDGDACNGAETCNAVGACNNGVPLDCDDQNDCTDDTCAMATGCAHANVNQGVQCEDGDPCTVADTCDGNGACAPGSNTGCGGAGGSGGASSSSSTSTSSSSTSTASSSSSSSSASSSSSSSGSSSASSTSASSSSTGSSTTGAGGDGGSGGAAAEGGCNCQVGGATDDRDSPALLIAVVLGAAVVVRKVGRRDGKGSANRAAPSPDE